MINTTRVDAERVIFIDYVLRNGAGEELDRSSPEQPLFYLHGAGNIIPGLERALEGKSVGDTLTAVIPPEEAYGVKLENSVQKVHRREFPRDFEITVGAQLAVEGPEGEPIPLWITDVKGAWVHLDRNHPLAGEQLHFEVEITRVRLASPEELAHGHPHGPEGGPHHH